MSELLLQNVKVDLEQTIDQPDTLKEIVATHLGIGPAQVVEARQQRRSIDARRGKPNFICTIFASIEGQPDILPANTIVAPTLKKIVPACQVSRPNRKVAIVGSGPAGLFAALRLSEAGLEPVIFDRGRDLVARDSDISRLLSLGTLDPDSNFHFGMGGAGTYSDGKLFTRLHQPQVRYVLEVLQKHGAGSHDKILVDAQPHVGTDRWPIALKSIRAELESRGCSFEFETKITGLTIKNKVFKALQLTDGLFDCEAAIIAPGNSARDLFESLLACGIDLATKPFAIGVRMTHPQEVIDQIQYGQWASHPALGPASYRLTTKYEKRGVYSFCMCPGGTVIPTPTEHEMLAINGMSNSARDSAEANAAIVATVSEDDLDSTLGPLAGLKLQREIEQAAYLAGEKSYRAPAQSLIDFLANKPTKRLPATNFRPGTIAYQIDKIFPGWLSSTLRKGLSSFCKKIESLADPRAVLLAAETRTSSPVRILRGPDGMCPQAVGLFPAGEGSGYAGGITSSAVDGIRTADHLIAWLEK
jgi:uncharacterized FAD-dependent dehydrogenase